MYFGIWTFVKPFSRFVVRAKVQRSDFPFVAFS